MDFGERISKQYVDAFETGQDARAAVNLHNNAAGRLVRIGYLLILYNYMDYKCSNSLRANNKICVAGSKSDHEKDLPLPWHVGELRDADVLDAAARVPRGGQLPESKARPSAQT